MQQAHGSRGERSHVRKAVPGQLPIDVPAWYGCGRDVTMRWLDALIQAPCVCVRQIGAWSVVFRW